MSRLEELIQELCPDGVEYRTLGSLGKFYGGLSGKSKDDFKNGNEKFVTYKNIFDNIALKTDIAETVKVAPNEKQNIIQYGDILFTGSSETPDECGMSSVLTEHIDDKLYLNSFCFGYRFTDPDCNILPQFSKYLFRSEALRKQIKRTANGVTRFNVSKKKMEKVMIPIPPLEVQREIVRILDTFTALTDELTEKLDAELNARRKQYEYYQNSLTSLFDSNTSFERLGNTCKMKSGKAVSATQISPKYTNNTPYQCYGGNGVRGYVSNMSHSGEFPIIGRQGALCGNVNYASGDFYATEHAVVVQSNGKYIQRFLYYLLKTMNLNQYKSQGAQPGLAVRNLENLIAPVPPLDEQRRIVSILDRFDALCNDLTSGLPAEIEARRKQYEYYRDKLLSFPPAEKGEES